MKNLWIFRFFYIKRLLEQKESPFVIKNESDAIKAACIDRILERTKPLLRIAKILVHRIAVKSIQNIRTRTFRSDYTKETIKSNPLFSQNELATFTKKHYVNSISIFGLIFCEAVLYVVIIPLYIPHAPYVIQIIVSLGLSLLIVSALNYGTEKYFAYQNALASFQRKELDQSLLKEYRDQRQLGFFLIILALLVTITVAIARIKFLEYIDPTGLSAERLQSVKQASFFASMGTLGLTVIAGILLAVIKYDQSKLGEKYQVFRYWKRMHTRRNTYTRQLITTAQELLAIIDKEINTHWQLCLDLKRVYKMQHEFDEKHKELYKEYQKDKDAENFEMTEALYRKYAYIQCAEEQIFKYGLRQSKEVKPIILYCLYILKLPETYISGELATAPQLPPEPSSESFSQNGKDTTHHFITPSNNHI